MQIDERAAFEAWAKEYGFQRDELDRCTIGIVSPDYFDRNTETTWQSWQARAALAAAPAADELATQLAPLPNRAGTPDLHDKIMNLSAWPSDDTVKHFDNPVIAYKLGHRDARHAAAELVLSALEAPTAAAPVVLPKPDMWRDEKGFRGYTADPGHGPWYTAETVRALLAGVSAPAAQPVALPTVELIGVKDGVETNLGTVPMPPTMKARELLRDVGFTGLDDDDGDGAYAMGACEQLIEYCQAYYGTNSATPAADALDAHAVVEKLPRYTYGYKSDEWGMGQSLCSYESPSGAFLRRDEVLAAIAAQAAKEGGAA